MKRKSKSEMLFSEFDQKSKKDWINKAIEDINGADFDKKLVWNVTENLDLDPFYTAEDIFNFNYLKDFHNQVLNVRDTHTTPRAWLNVEDLVVADEKKSNTAAGEALRMGADGIHFTLPDHKKVDIEQLLDQLLPNIHPIKFKIKSSPQKFVDNYLEFIIARSDIPLTDVSGGLNVDPVQNLSLTGEMATADFDKLASLIESTEQLNDFKILTVNGDHFLNSGADTVQEIAFSMNSVVEHLDRLTALGLSMNQIIKNLELNFSIGTNYFLEIAKIRAVRVLLFHILETFQKNPQVNHNIKIHCDTSVWTKTIYDPYTNMLRNTTEAMSAIIGGADSISIKPFDEVFLDSNDFSRRISRNISSLLKEESYFDKVADPAAGSYYLEILTDKLIDKSLDLFKEIESVGGYYHAFKNGLIQKKINLTRNKKYDFFAQRRKVIVGTNQFANPLEKINTARIKIKPLRFSSSEKKLTPSRASIPFEKLRLETDKFIKKNRKNKRPEVFLSLIGDNQLKQKARSTFAAGFFSCAGFTIVESSPSSTLPESIEKARESNADIVVICGSDEDYITYGKDYAKAFKSNTIGMLVIAGNPEEIKSELMAAGVDDFIHLKTNVINSLHNFQKKLKIIEVKNKIS